MQVTDEGEGLVNQSESRANLRRIEGGRKKDAQAPKNIVITQRRLSRMKARMAEIGMLQSALANHIQISPSAITFILSGKTQRTKHFPAIAEALGVSLDWLLGIRAGEYDEDQLQLGERDADRVRDMIRQVPEIDLSGRYKEMQSGIPITGQRNPISMALLADCCNASPSHVMTMQGIGDVMQPVLWDRDLIFVDASRRQIDRPDRIWLIRYAGMLMVRRLRPTPQGVRMACEIPSMTPEVVREDTLEVLGLVVSVLRKL